MGEFDERVHAGIAEGAVAEAATLTLREYGAEIFGFLAGIVGERDADEVLSAFSERLWRALNGFEGRCSVRTWCYVLARHELGRFQRGQRRHANRCVPISQYEDALAVVRSASRSTFATAKRQKLAKLRDELPDDDRTLLILRIDRNLAWDDIALAFSDAPETMTAEDKKRVAARLRKRFQLIKDRLKQQLVSRKRGVAATGS
jgi:RNA polymerase sigma-70 factor (ECF subfamily)